MEDKEYMDEIEFNSKSKVKRKKKILEDLDDINYEEVTLPSEIYNRTKEKKKKEKDEETKKKEETTDSYKFELEEDNEWFAALDSFTTPKMKKKGKNNFDFDFNLDGKKKKKKKKNKKQGTVSHKKDFEPEIMLLRSLQMEQSKFVDSLQKKYDQLESTKSSARGVGKFTTDLIDSINGARSLSMQLIDKIISAKKSVADLDFKERKEFGSNSNSEQQNLTNYASTYLKQVMTAGRNNFVGQQVGNPNYDNLESYDDGDDYNDLFSSIEESLGETNRDSDVEKYLKYENDNVEIHVFWNDDAPDDNLDQKYYFVAYTGDGRELDPNEYPLPEKTKLSINRSTETATDIYGNKYKMTFL